MASIFSKIIKREISAHIIVEDDKHIAFLDAFPIAKGHTLVVPKKESEKIFDLSLEEYTELMNFTYKVAQALEKSIPCLKVGMAVQGLEVPHVHVHLVPLNSSKDLVFSNKIEITNEEQDCILQKIKGNI